MTVPKNESLEARECRLALNRKQCASWRERHPDYRQRGRRQVGEPPPPRRPRRSSRDANRERIRSIRSASGCVDCGSRGQLHFHHVDPATKLYTVGRMAQRSWPIIEAEIAKCVVVCKPCHDERHRRLAA